MRNFLINKTARKIKIILTIFSIVNIILIWILIFDFMKDELPLFYIFFTLIWFILSLFFRKDKSIKWNEETWKVIKKTEIVTIIVIIWIILFRNFVIPVIFKEFNILFIWDATLFITLWFFIWKLYFTWDRVMYLYFENK